MTSIATRLPRPVPISRMAFWLGVAIAALVAGAVVGVTPLIGVAVGLALILASAAFAHPPAGAYVLIAMTPLIVGIDRGSIVPLLRPNEALALLLGAAVLTRRILEVANGQPLRLRLRTTDASIIFLVVAGSLFPLLWLVIRGRAISSDDLLYGVALLKYCGIYLIVRSSIRTEGQVRHCLWLSLGAGAVVALVGILQALNLFGVPGLLASYYAPYGDVGALYLGRGSSTLAQAQAMADVMAFNLAIAVGLLVKGSKRRGILVSASILFVFGSLASGQFSGAFALVVTIGALGLVTGSLHRAVFASVPLLAAAAVALQPVIERRLKGFSSPAGLPQSWVGRLENLKAYFWPELTRDFNYVLGVQPAGRLPTRYPNQYVFIESGHTWLLWTGGIPLLVAYFAFLWTNMRAAARIARRRADAFGAAGVASFSALAVLAVVTIFDPHLTLRGSADLNFSLLALAHTAMRFEPSAPSKE